MTTDPRISPERLLALKVLRRVADGAFADRAFAAEARKADLDPRARAAAMRLTFGTVQRRRTLDWLIDDALERPNALEADVREVLRIGVYELIWSDRVPASAAVDQTVRLARTLHGVPRRRTARAGLVNAVLRRIADDGAQALAGLEDVPGLRGSAIRCRIGSSRACRSRLALWRTGSWLRPTSPPNRRCAGTRCGVRGRRSSRRSRLVGTTTCICPKHSVLEGAFAIEDSPLWTEGRAMAQSRASMVPARALDPRPGERILDLCAAPGAKSTHLAALAENRAEIVCVELHESRARALQALAERMGARLEVRVGDGRTLALEGEFDAVLVDPPCTGVGVLSSRAGRTLAPPSRGAGRAGRTCSATCWSVPLSSHVPADGSCTAPARCWRPRMRTWSGRAGRTWPI